MPEGAAGARTRARGAAPGDPVPTVTRLSPTRRVFLFGALAAALAAAAFGAPAPENPPADESAARERIRVLRDAAETGRESAIDDFVAFVAGYVRDRPGSPLSGELRRDLPRDLKVRARDAERKGEGRRALALYRIFERLPFAPPDREVTRHRRALESAFIAARESPNPGHAAVVARESEDLAIPVRWPGRREGLTGVLHFRNRLAREWRAVPVTAGPRGTLQATIPGGEVVPPAIDYWSEVRDASGTVRRAGSPERPIVVRVLPR